MCALGPGRSCTDQAGGDVNFLQRNEAGSPDQPLYMHSSTQPILLRG